MEVDRVALLANVAEATASTDWQLHNRHLCQLIVNVSGVLMPRADCQSLGAGSAASSTVGLQCDRTPAHTLVSTPTTQRQLHEAALAVSVGLPILLQGPTGAGKTSLVEALAQHTARNAGMSSYTADSDGYKLINSVIIVLYGCL